MMYLVIVDTHVEEITLSFGLLEYLYVTLMQDVK